MLPRKIRSRQGVTLPVAIGVTCFLVILTASLIGIALTSITSTSSSISSRQAYLNAKSALEYAISYYSDSGNVSDVTRIHNKYMAMKDKEGGTTREGALSVADEDEAAKYATYVVADYIDEAGGGPLLKLKAFATSGDAFGQRKRTVSIAGKFVPQSTGELFPPPEIIPVYETPPMQNVINLHVKQYPGQNWVPFYYMWTYKDVAGLYSVTNNCYGLETYYKSKSNLSGSLVYYKQSGSGYTKASQNVPSAFTKNYKEGYQDSPKDGIPASPWNAVGDVGDPRNGPATSFSRGSSGWFDATERLDDNNVNFFNLIITKKGQVLNGAGGSWHPETQTSEMLHLWYLFNDDRNIYFEMLKPDLMYKEGAGWDGLESLSDRVLVYANNKKTTVHFRVKGIGDTVAEANTPPTNAPVINSVTVDGVSILNSPNFSAFSSGNASALPADIFKTSNLEQVWQSNFMSGNEGRGNVPSYFYGASSGSIAGTEKMLYEGCGWWVANIACSKAFDMEFTYYDRSGNPVTNKISNIQPNTNNEVFIVAYESVAPDGSRTQMAEKCLTEKKACTQIGLDYQSYTTVKVRSSQRGSAVAPYLDYKMNNNSSTAKRRLVEKVDEARTSYVADDYEDASFNALQDVLNSAIALVNDPDIKSDDVYDDMVKEIDDAIDELKGHTKIVSREKYKEYEDLVNECTAAVDAQNNSGEVVYDVTAFGVFMSGDYPKAKELIDNGKILNGKDDEGTVFTASKVADMKDKLQGEFDALKNSKLEKDELVVAIENAKNYLDEGRYEKESVDRLRDEIQNAENVKKNGGTQREIDDELVALNAALQNVLGSELVEVDKTALVALIALCDERIANKVDCTDDSYRNLVAVRVEAVQVREDINSTQQAVDDIVKKLQKAYDDYVVYKPGSGTTSNNSKSTDTLLNEGKIRIWVEGLLPGTVIETYKESEGGSEKSDSTEFVVNEFMMQLFKDDALAGTYQLSSMDKISLQDLAYVDVGLNTFNKVRFTLTTARNELGEYDPSTGGNKIIGTENVVFTSKDIAVDDMSDGNLAFTFSDLIVATVGGADSNIVEMNRAKLSELYISGVDNAVVEVTGNDGKTIAYNTLEEGPYRVARYLNRTDNSKATVRHYSTDTKEYIYSNIFDSKAGQYVVKLDETNKTDRSTIAIDIPYNSYKVSGSSTTYVGIKIGDNEPVEAYYDGIRYVYTADFKGSFTFTVVRYYGDKGTEKTESNPMTVSEAGEIEIEYKSDDSIEASYTGYTFKTVPAILIASSSIYPMYSSSSGSSAYFNSVGELSGIVSTKFVDDVLTVPTVTAATGGTQVKNVSFDYFSDPGHAGRTVIWININEAPYNGRVPNVYLWNGSTEFNGAWPGGLPMSIRAYDSSSIDNGYYYVAVDGSVTGCIVSIGGTKLGGDGDIILSNCKGKYIYMNESAVTQKRASGSSVVPTYHASAAGISRADMTATDLRMPFVGGSKISFTNESYVKSYNNPQPRGSFKTYWDAWIVDDSLGHNLFGGKNGNRESEGRIGDTRLSMVYDWYERKIPVDQSVEYTFQIKGLAGSTSGSWFNDGFSTNDNTFTSQVDNVYGNVWLDMRSKTKTYSLYTDLKLSTVDPENVDIEDEQAVYFDGGSDIVSVKIDTSGIGGGTSVNMQSDPDGTTYLYAKISSQTPFLNFTAYYNDGTTKYFKASLQGGDLRLFKPTMNAGTGGWDNFVPTSIARERVLYEAHALYYGSVLARAYDDKGNPKDLGNNGGLGSFKYAEAIKTKIINRYFDSDGNINSAGKSANVDEINRWVSAYRGLYNALSKARAYVPGRNYPENMYGSGSDMYSRSSIDAIRNLIDQGEAAYESGSSTTTSIIDITNRINNATENANVATQDDAIRFFFVDETGTVASSNSEVLMQYQLTDTGTVKTVESKFFTEYGSYPAFYVKPTSNAIYNIQFVIRYPDGTTESCSPLQKVDLAASDWYSDWYFIYQPVTGGGDLSRWRSQAVSDARTIRSETITIGSANRGDYVFDLKTIPDSYNGTAPVARTETEAINMDFPELYLIFKNDVTVIGASGGDYEIKAGVYTFQKASMATQDQIKPLVYKNVGTSSSPDWRPELDLSSSLAKDYFENPGNYGAYVDDSGMGSSCVDAVDIGWIVNSGDKYTIVAGDHATNKTVNIIANDGSFAANRRLSYMTTEKMSFRWKSVNDLMVYNNVTFAADELKIASAGTIVSPNFGKHFKLGTYDNASTMKVEFLTDLDIEYYDAYGDYHEFTIQRGTCTIKRKDGATDYIADLFDEDYWKSAKVQYDAGGGNGTTGGLVFDRFGGNYTND